MIFPEHHIPKTRPLDLIGWCCVNDLGHYKNWKEVLDKINALPK